MRPKSRSFGATEPVRACGSTLSIQMGCPRRQQTEATDESMTRKHLGSSLRGARHYDRSPGRLRRRSRPSLFKSDRISRKVDIQLFWTAKRHMVRFTQLAARGASIVGVYRDHLLPRMQNKVMDRKDLREVRSRVCSALSGDV